LRGANIYWLYLIDVNLEPDMVARIAASEYDMVVLDFISSEENNTDYPLAEVIDQLHNAPHPKLVIAYIDTGQAEEYRTYWQPGWGIGDPKWIVGADPDGWEGNFPVAYWYDEWQEIWLGEEGYLGAILDAGFDGVYLDWVEAYSDENVITFAEEDGVDPRQEMVWWVEGIADFSRARRPDFIVIAQNAAELAEDDDYLAVIDAIAQEQICRATVPCPALTLRWIPKPTAKVSPRPAANSTTNTPTARCTSAARNT
jgi:cysteinyl-tRNA synthetase